LEPHAFLPTQNPEAIKHISLSSIILPFPLSVWQPLRQKKKKKEAAACKQHFERNKELANDKNTEGHLF